MTPISGQFCGANRLNYLLYRFLKVSPLIESAAVVPLNLGAVEVEPLANADAAVDIFLKVRWQIIRISFICIAVRS
ncbi:hypothetical protein HJ526_17085 [Donghicola sp. C2-DW-16]|uniref:Uncharacterized protein n=1 Tax=Donghicola mangrovi TaxID=2729614 RepID=A0ABX2PI13_9RHOB|nr:hypothetical protein [Donghicola mangrovi]NVO29141.1 hypothetical protein [Donghicola mangrovi]